MRQEQIEQPTRIRVGRMIGSAPRQSEEALTAKVSSRLDDEVTARMWAMIAAAGDDPGDQAAESAGDPGEAGEATGPEGLAYSSSEKQRLGSRPGNESWICPVWLCVGVRARPERRHSAHGAQTGLLLAQGLAGPYPLRRLPL